MARFNIVVPHRLSQAEALRRIQNEIGALKGQYGDKITGLRDNWNSNSMYSGVGHGICGIGSRAGNTAPVEIHGELPWLAMPFKGRIEATIRERLLSIL